LLPQLTNSTDAYLQLVKEVFPSGLIGLVVVIMSAALISTIAAALNSLSAVFTMDIYLKRHPENAGEKQIKRTGRLLVVVGAAISVFLAIGITFIQGLSFFNIFQSVLGFLAPPMTATFLFAVFWKKTSVRAVNLTLTLGTLFSIGSGILYYSGMIFRGMHFLYLSFMIFVVLAVFIVVFSLVNKSASEIMLEYKPVKINNKVKIAWILLIALMIGLYIFFN
jgi:SSS family solute:Na+ symporter